MMINREVTEAKIGLNKATQLAEQYLQDLDFEELALLESNQYDNVGVFHFIPQVDDVWIYPDVIQVKVALDNGDILGLVAKDYFENHRDREIHSPKITEEEARKEVNPNLKIHENHLAIIEDDLGEEVLAYVFLGTLGNDSYKIFINAESGDEERVEKLKQAEIRY